MNEFNEYRQPSALAWKPEMSGTWVADESQDTQRKLSSDGFKPAETTKPLDVAVTSTRPGDTLNFGRDQNGYYCFKASGDDHYAKNYFTKAQQWAYLETLDYNGNRSVTSYRLSDQIKNVDKWLADQKPVDTPVQAQPSHLDMTPVFKNVEQPKIEQQKVVGKPLLPDQYHHLSGLVDSMNLESGSNQLSVIRMFAGLADKCADVTIDYIGGLHDYIEGTRNSDPKLKLDLAVAEMYMASTFIVDKDESGQLIFNVTDKSAAGAYINAAVEQLDLAIKNSNAIKGFGTHGLTNFQARTLKNLITGVRGQLDTGVLEFLQGCPVPQLLPPER